MTPDILTENVKVNDKRVIFPKLHDKEFLRYHYLTLFMSTTEIAELIGCGRGSVVRAFHKYNIPIRPKSRNCPKLSLQDKIIDDLRNGKSFKEIAEQHNCSYLTVMNQTSRLTFEVSNA